MLQSVTTGPGVNIWEVSDGPGREKQLMDPKDAQGAVRNSKEQATQFITKTQGVEENMFVFLGPEIR